MVSVLILVQYFGEEKLTLFNFWGKTDRISSEKSNWEFGCWQWRIAFRRWTVIEIQT